MAAACEPWSKLSSLLFIDPCMPERAKPGAKVRGAVATVVKD